MAYEQAVANIQKELRAYINEHRLKSLVLGVSGGIDSALCAALAMPVCIEAGVPLIGRSIPIETNCRDEIERARMVGEAFCTEFEEADMTEAYLGLAPRIHDEYRQKGVDRATLVRQGNIKARLRMILLYDVAARHGGLVLSTDNYTEYLLGFWTIHGDHADYGMIQHMWKNEVYAMSAELADECGRTGDIRGQDALRVCIDAVATDGLGITQSDCEQFGVNGYDEVDNILKQWVKLKRELSSEALERHALRHNPVVVRHEQSHFKRRWPIAIPRARLGLEEDL